MSVQRYEAKDGTRWRVRWRDAQGKMRSRSFISKRDAQGFDTDIKARKFRGEALPRPGRQTLASAFEEWWRLVGTQKATSTQKNYLALWNAHIRGRFDHHLLMALSAEPQLIDELRDDMQRRGVGLASQRKTLTVLSAVLSQCVKWRKIPSNPVLQATKPSAAVQRAARPFPPIVVERIRQEVEGRETKDQTGRRGSGDAVLIGLMAYAGLRPQEALALRWGDVGKQVLTIDKAVSFGEEKSTKTNHNRTVPLVAPLADDLRAWRSALGSPPDHALVLAAPDGGLWSHAAFNNWRNRVWKPAVRRLAASHGELEPLADARPYDCRGSFVSLHLRAQSSPLEVARWAGHSPQVMFRHYAHVIEELIGEPRVSPERQIVLARQALAERSDDEVQRFVAEGLKPLSEASSVMKQALFAPRLVDG